MGKVLQPLSVSFCCPCASGESCSSFASVAVVIGTNLEMKSIFFTISVGSGGEWKFPLTFCVDVFSHLVLGLQDMKLWEGKCGVKGQSTQT